MTLVAEAWAEGLRPEPQLNLSEWCDRHRLLPDTAAEPGRWRTDRVPYLREPLDALSPGNGVERVVVMKAAQTGGTELALNLLAYIVGHAPGTALVVQPSLDMARRFVSGRFDKMAEAMPVLLERIGPVGSKKRSNTQTYKRFPGGEIIFAGSNSAASLRSAPARYVVLDEVDAFAQDLEGEGDPAALAEARSITYRGRRKILMVSTPTIAGASRIEAAYNESDQRAFLTPCPECAEPFELRWEHLTWPEGRRDLAHAVCPSCGSVIEERDKTRMVAAGFWQAQSESSDGRTRGYSISGLISPFQSWGELAIEHARVWQDPPRYKAFVNTKLGLPWREDEAANLDAATLAGRAEPFGPEIDDRVGVVTAGVDVQKDWIALHVIGWAEGEEAYSLAYHTLHGDFDRDLWQRLDELLTRPVRLPGGRELPIKAVCIDTGGSHTQSALEFCAPRHRRGVFGIKGSSSPNAPLWPRKPSWSKRGGRWPVYIVGVGTGKETIYSRLTKDEGPGALHFPDDRDASFFEELTAEKPVTRYVKGRPRREWVKSSRDARNEALDCSVYALAALKALEMAGMNLDAEAATAARGQRASVPTKPKGPRVIRSKFLGR